MGMYDGRELVVRATTRDGRRKKKTLGGDALPSAAGERVVVRLVKTGRYAFVGAYWEGKHDGYRVCEWAADRGWTDQPPDTAR